jgi:hypothetical protein
MTFGEALRVVAMISVGLSAMVWLLIIGVK